MKIGFRISLLMATVWQVLNLLRVVRSASKLKTDLKANSLSAATPLLGGVASWLVCER